MRRSPVQIRLVLCFTAFRTHPGPEVRAIWAVLVRILVLKFPSRIGPGRAEPDFLPHPTIVSQQKSAKMRCFFFCSISLPFFVFRFPLLFWGAFSFFPTDFKGFAKRKALVFFRGFPCFFSKKQGLEGLEAQQRYSSDRAILVAIVSQDSFVPVFVGYRTIIARYVAKWGIAQMCLCEIKYQGGYRTILGERKPP